MESRSIVRRRTSPRRPTQWLASGIGAVALLAALGSASVLAADPLPTADDPKLDAQELPIVGRDEPIVVIDDPVETIDDPIIVTLAQPAPLSVEEPGQELDVRPDPADVTVAPGPTPATVRERADGSVWWCPPTTGQFQLRLPCRMISAPPGATIGAGAGRWIIGGVRPIVADAGTLDEPDAMDTEAIADAEFELPATDTGPALGQTGMDPGMATLLALVLYALAWAARKRSEASSTR